MNRRPTDPAGKPFLRVKFDDAKPKPKPATKSKPSSKPSAAEMAAVERGNREQARETQDLKAKRPMAKGGKVMKKPVKKYAKGGSIDGCATKGKTKTKMVKMAMGGLANRGMMMGGQNQGGPAMATFKRGGSCGMKKGK